jgi:hypothetical protein
MDFGRVIVAGGGVLCAGLFVLAAAAFAVFFACVHVLYDGEEARRADGWAWACGLAAVAGIVAVEEIVRHVLATPG